MSRKDYISASQLRRELDKILDGLWTLGALLSTFKSRVLPRTAEARRFNGDLDALSLAVQRMQRERASLQEKSQRWAGAHEWAIAEL